MIHNCYSNNANAGLHILMIMTTSSIDSNIHGNKINKLIIYLLNYVYFQFNKFYVSIWFDKLIRIKLILEYS